MRRNSNPHPGNEDRRGAPPGHAETLAALRQAAENAEGSAALAATKMREVVEWIDRSGVTGYYASERDHAAQVLLDARDEARKLTVHIDWALAQMRKIP